MTWVSSHRQRTFFVRGFINEINTGWVRSVAARSSGKSPGPALPLCIACSEVAACPAALWVYAIRVDKNLQTLEGCLRLPRQAEALWGHSCVATEHSTLVGTPVYLRPRPHRGQRRQKRPLSSRGKSRETSTISWLFMHIREERNWGAGADGCQVPAMRTWACIKPKHHLQLF